MEQSEERNIKVKGKWNGGERENDVEAAMGPRRTPPPHIQSDLMLSQLAI